MRKSETGDSNLKPQRLAIASPSPRCQSVIPLSVCQRKTKDRADGMREKVPIPRDRI